MFLENKYTKWYYSIIRNRIDIPINGYKENHHIITRCFGGTDEKSNMVYLTAREHFICHLLLVRMLVGIQKSKMALVAHNMMFRRNSSFKIGSHTYQFLKEERSKGGISEEQRKNMRIGQSNRSIETRKKIGDVHRGKKVSDKTKDLLKQKGIGNTNKRGKLLSENSKKLISEVQLKHHQSMTQEEKLLIKIARKQSVTEVWKKRRAGLLPMPNRKPDVVAELKLIAESIVL